MVTEKTQQEIIEIFKKNIFEHVQIAEKEIDDLLHQLLVNKKIKYYKIGFSGINKCFSVDFKKDDNLYSTIIRTI